MIAIADITAMMMVEMAGHAVVVMAGVVATDAARTDGRFAGSVSRKST